MVWWKCCFHVKTPHYPNSRQILRLPFTVSSSLHGTHLSRKKQKQSPQSPNIYSTPNSESNPNTLQSFSKAEASKGSKDSMDCDKHMPTMGNCLWVLHFERQPCKHHSVTSQVIKHVQGEDQWQTSDKGSKAQTKRNVNFTKTLTLMYLPSTIMPSWLGLARTNIFLRHWPTSRLIRYPMHERLKFIQTHYKQKHLSNNTLCQLSIFTTFTHWEHAFQNVHTWEMDLTKRHQLRDSSSYAESKLSASRTGVALMSKRRQAPNGFD